MKNFLESLTVWGIGVVGAIEALEYVGGVPPGSMEAVATLAQGIALAVATVGRWRANKPLTVGPSR